jgi:hypothetical protein
VGSNSAYPLAEAVPKASRCNGLEISLISLKIRHKTTYRFNKPPGRLRDWTPAFVRGQSTDMLCPLKDLSAGVTSCIRYQSRDDEGTHSPTQTLDRGWDRVGISRCFLRTQGAASGSARVSSLAISTIPISKASDQ